MSVDTKELILDAAERLMAERGIDAVSLRSIIAEAHVNLAAVHYHFGSKEALVRKVFERRVEPLNRERLALLDRAEADGAPRLEDVLRALFEPALRLHERSRGEVFTRMCGRIYAEASPLVQEIFDELFKELADRLYKAFRRALPEASDVALGWAIHFAVGAMIHTMLDNERLNRFTGGLCDVSDTDAVIERMVRFCAAGIRAAAAAEPRADDDVATPQPAEVAI